VHPFNWKKSVKAVRILAWAYARHLARRTPLWGHLYVTRKCNLRCGYCFFRDPSKRDLSTDGVRGVLDRMRAMGISFLAFHGGEPTIRKDFPEILRHAHDAGFFTYLNTNGTMLTPGYIDRLGEAGVDLINMSVDSVVEFEHSGKDLMHGKKVLEDLLAARERHGFEITVNLVLNNRNIDVALQTLELMHAFRVPISIGFIVKHLFHDEQEPSLFFRTDAEKRRLFEVLDEIIAMRRRGMNIIEPTRYFEDLKRFVNHELDWECMAGGDSIGIDTLGELKFCGTLPTEAVSIFDVERLDTRALHRWRKDRYGDCQERCVSNCRYVTYYYYRHPLRFVVEMAWFRRAVWSIRERLSRLLGRPDGIGSRVPARV